jgi:hypothetical protein
MSATALARLIDLALQLEADAQRPAEELRRRDRVLGQQLGASSGDARLRAWLERVRPADPGSTGARAARALRGLSVLATGLGVLLGAGSAAALFWYDGTHPVNVVRLLGFFVGLQLLLLLGTAVLCLPERWRRRLPGLDLAKDLLVLLSPGRLVGSLRRVLPAGQREAATRFASLAGRHRRLYGDVEKWLWLATSQRFGVALHAGALGTALALVAFTDLAFGWSTTLAVDPGALHRLTNALSLPWSGLWPDAVPSATLIEATQYFRGASGGGHDPLRSAPWWRFVAACMLCYALLPRVGLLAFASWRLGAALRRARSVVPGVYALRDRLDRSLVETTAEGAEAPGPTPVTGVRRAAAAPAPGARCAALIWAGFPLASAESLQRVGLVATSLQRAGEGALEADAAAIAALRRAPRDELVAVVVKAWEPPVLELQDFLRALRTALGAGRVVALVPLALDAAGEPSVPDAAARAIWQHALARSSDPWLVLHAAGDAA